MTDNWREISVGGKTVRVNDQDTPPPDVLERVRRDTERGERSAKAEAELRAEHEARGREAAFADALESHVEDRRRFYELKGVPSEVFESELQPEIERKFLKGERDHVEEERERRSASAY